MSHHLIDRRRNRLAGAILLVLTLLPTASEAQHVTHASVCHPGGSDTYPVGDRIVFTYHPRLPPIFPKLPVTRVPPCIDIRLAAEDVTGKPPFEYTWSTDSGQQWTGNPVVIDTGTLPTGIANIVLEVANDWGTTTGSINLDITRLVGPLAEPIADESPSPDLTVAVMASAEGAHEWRWDFGDGTVTPWLVSCDFTTSVATHTYATPGTYSVVAYARTCREGPIASPPLEVSVGDPNAIQLLEFQAQGCTDHFCVFATGDPVSFAIETSATPDRYYYDWDGNGTIDEVTSQPVTHAYSAFGVYTPVLTVERGTATDTLVHPTLLLVN